MKKVKQNNCDLELRYMFLGQIFAKNTKNDPKTLFEASKSVKKKSEYHGTEYSAELCRIERGTRW